MKKLLCCIAFCQLLTCGSISFAQEIRFNQVIKNIKGEVTGMIQDQHGFIWISTFDQGLKRFDGISLKSYTSDQRNPHSLASNIILCLAVDADNMIWLGTGGRGLEKFDPSTNTFTHFRYGSSGLSNDTVSAVLVDHLGNLWVATAAGLDMLDRKTGKFTHYASDANDPTTLSHNTVSILYEDKKGVLWVGCITWFNNEKPPGKGGLNRFDRNTGKFTRYLHDPANPNSLADNRINAIREDSSGNFWIVTLNGNLQSMDRSKGTFTRFYPDPLSSGALGQVPVSKERVPFINLVIEDAAGALWIGTGASGMNRYDPVTQQSTHYGPVYEGEKLLSAKDTATGFVSRNAVLGLNSKDGLFWVCTYDGSLYNLNYKRTIVPFHNISQEEANSFYCEDNNNILWIGTEAGLLRRDITTREEKLLKPDPKNKNSPSAKISAIRADKEGYLWLGTRNGLDRFDRVSGKFLQYKYDPADPGSLANNNIWYLFIDHAENLWVSSDSGISRMNKHTGSFTNYKRNYKDSSSYTAYQTYCITEDGDHYIWTGTDNGALRLDVNTGKIRNYLSGNFIKSLCVDSKGVIWAGADLALYYYDKANDNFVLFANEHSEVDISGVINVIEDNKKNIWVSTSTSIIKINEDRTRVKKFTESNGVRYTIFFYNDNYKGKDGKLFLGVDKGYYAFYPELIKDSSFAPNLIISGFKLGDKVIKAGASEVLSLPIWKTDEIKLAYHQNVFSFDFFAVDYVNPGSQKYLFMLENYDDTWRDIGSDHRALFYNVPPGKYNFRVKAISGDGASVEKSIRIIITPPWWKTWWAYCLYGLLAIVVGYLIYKYQKYYIVRREREKTQQKELTQAREIEKAYGELKATQTQLIQSEKMASLGELTAGIAHEIQNPLNFVNNFSEVNTELIDEMKEELNAGNSIEAIRLADSIKDNNTKISHHGRRADSIVKGMLQHSRNSSGQKEPTDINTLVDECMRLSYHGLRAKDKSFNAKMETSFDDQLPKVTVAPQDIGRVILNLFTNGFYSVMQKKKELGGSFEPIVTVKTSLNKATGVGRDTVSITIRDNGNGVPKKIVEKIFQPFFTTKPVGEGTGLGLSMSYDIVTKGHNGELIVDSREGEYASFTIILPI